MTKKQLEKTKLAKEIKEMSFSSYNKFLEKALNPLNIFDIYYNNENGNWVWAIALEDFWMDAVETKEGAINLCEKMGWKYNIKDGKRNIDK